MTDYTKSQIQEAINFCKKDPDTMDIIALARHIHSVPPILKESMPPQVEATPLEPQSDWAR